MLEEQTKIRTSLFAKYFEVEEGMELPKFFEKIEEIRNKWSEFHSIIRKNVPFYYKHDYLKMVKIISKENKSYLIIKLHSWDYLVIDLEMEKAIIKEEAKYIFDEEEFFIENFNERERNKNQYLFFNSCKNSKEIIDFYFQNETIFKLPTVIEYCLNVQEAYTGLHIDLVGNFTHLGFYAKRQGLKEQYFLDSNLCFVNDTDIQNRIGKTKMQEMLEQIKTIKIPYEVIPEYFKKEDYTREIKKV